MDRTHESYFHRPLCFWQPTILFCLSSYKTSKIKEVSVEEFIDAIQKLPFDEIREGWIGWLSDYNNPGPYGRLPDQNHSARYAYNQIVYPEMLLWLIQASGVRDELVKLARSDRNEFTNFRQQAAAIRKRVPWEVLEQALWKPS